MRSLSVAAALVTLSITATASAQAPGLTPPQAIDDEAPARQPPRPPMAYEAPTYQMLPTPELPPVKSEGTATMLSIGATAAGFALIAGGANHDSEGMASLGLLTLIVGPSFGHIYAGETSHAVGMSLVRGGAFLAFVVGFAKTLSAECGDCGAPAPGTSTSNDQGDGERLMWIGGVTFVAATVYDIMDASRAARRTNEKSRSVMVVPTVVNLPSGPAPAVGLSGRF